MGRAARVLGLAALAAVAVHPLFRVSWFENHETTMYLARVVETVQCWDDGQWRARWFPDLAGGFGLPYLSFYAPLTFWGGALFERLGAGVPLALKLVLSLSTLGAMAGAYRLARTGAGRPASFAAAALYGFSPYVVRDLWVRGDLAEYVALAFLPWALAGLVRGAPGPSEDGDDPGAPAGRFPAGIAALGGAGAILSHNILGLITGLAMAAAGALTLGGAGSGRRRAALARVLAGGAGALALSAFFWWPALAEKDFTRLAALQEGTFAVEDHFLDPGDLLGFGGPPREVRPGQPERLGFELRLLPLAGLLGLAALRRRRGPVFRLAALGLLLSAAVVLVLEPARPVFDAFPLLRFVQFPWRFLAVTSLGLALLGAAGIESLLPSGRVRLAGAGLLGAAAVLAALDLARPVAEIRVQPGMLDPAYYRDRGLTLGAVEFTPVWAERPEPMRFQEGVALPAGGRMSDLERGVARWEFTVEADRAQTVVLRCFWFPEWRGTLDGEPVEIRARTGSGFVEFDCPAGPHRFTGRLVDTPVRRITGYASLAAWGLAGWGFLRRRRVR